MGERIFNTAARTPNPPSRRFICLVCGWVYTEEEGCPEENIPPGTSWDDIPDDWRCPDCDAAKYDFEILEI